MRVLSRLSRRALSFAQGLVQMVLENGLLLTLRFGGSRLAGTTAPIQVNVGGSSLFLRPNNQDLSVARDSLVRRELAKVSEYRFTKEVDFIIDAGGYIGTSAIAFAKMFPSATVVSLEPSDENFALLCQNVRRYANIVPLKAALVAVDGDVSLYDRGTGQWGFTIKPGPTEEPLRKLHSVAGISINGLMNRFERTGLDILKMDIEGGEKDVLKGDLDWTSNTAVLIVELHDRIVSGCSAAFDTATLGMKRERLSKDKWMASW